jgi:hypothetical protein
MADVEKAQKIAQKIGDAVVKKFPKHELYIRRTDLGNGKGYIEIALRPEGGGYNQEISTSYADEFFVVTSAEALQEKAKRILYDFRVHFGQV